MNKLKLPGHDTWFSLYLYHKPLKLLRYELTKIWNPSWFQGSKEKSRYFEGWYFKNVSEHGENCWSFIPGISLVGKNTHAFVQAINGSTGDTYYFRYPPQDFLFSKNGFEIRVSDNYFSDKGFILNLNDGKNHFSGSISITGRTHYKAGFLRPGIMGWYRYVPFMECYHGVVSLFHNIEGDIVHNGRTINFSRGRGYIEKDWGSSMPQSWIWMHSNHFDKNGTSFMLSVARIPWIGKSFTGFLGFFHHNGKTITFSTYTGAKIRELTYGAGTVNLQINTNKYKFEIEGQSMSAGALKAPVLGAMDRLIHESIDAELTIKASLKNDKILFVEKGVNAGLEMVGDLKLLQT